MSAPARTPRWASTAGSALLLVGAIIAPALACGLLSAATVAVNKLFGGAARPVIFFLLVGVVFARSWWRRRRQRRADSELRHWEGTAGWEPATRSWPWEQLVRFADTVQVLRAYAKRVDGFPVVTGELTFVDDGLGTTVDRRAGQAAFAVVTLPRPAPSMAVRVYRNPLRRREGDDEFRRRFRPVGTVSHRLDNPELQAAHVRGDIPPWTLIEDELFVFVPLDGPLRPRDLEEAVRKAIRVVRLLDVGADESAVEVGEDG